jgi:hypothetical protein
MGFLLDEQLIADVRGDMFPHVRYTILATQVSSPLI